MKWFLLTRFLDLVRDIRILKDLDDRFCALLNAYFSDVSINRWQIFKGIFFTVHLGAAATEIRRVSFLRIFFLWINLLCSIADA